MVDLKREEQKLYEMITKKFIKQLSHSRESNIGVFRAMQLFAKKAKLWELQMVLLIAREDPITTEAIIKELQSSVSKSTVYRKISEYFNSGILEKRPDKTIQLCEDFRSLAIVGKLYSMLKKPKPRSD